MFQTVEKHTPIAVLLEYFSCYFGLENLMFWETM